MLSIRAYLTERLVFLLMTIMTVGVASTVAFHKRYNSRSQVASAQVRMEYDATPKETNSSSIQFKQSISELIIVRVVEQAQGDLLDHEVFLYIFDAVLILLMKSDFERVASERDCRLLRKGGGNVVEEWVFGRVHWPESTVC